MELLIKDACVGQEIDFAEIRAKAMKHSLEAVNRYDNIRVRRRLLDNYKIENTKAIYLGTRLIGVYSITVNDEYIYVDHLYIDPSECGKGYGGIIINTIKKEYYKSKPIRLNALKLSTANQFYLKNGFCKIGESEYDNIYEYKKQPNKR